MSLTYFILTLGITMFILIVLQILMGLKIIKIKFKWHKRNGFLIITLALIHGLTAFLFTFGFISF